MTNAATFRASLALIDPAGALVEVATRDFDTMDGGELDSWLAEFVASGQLIAGWQWGVESPDDLTDESGNVIGQCVAEEVSERDRWGGRA